MHIVTKLGSMAAMIVSLAACDPEVINTKHTVFVAGKPYTVHLQRTRSSSSNREEATAMVNGEPVSCSSFNSCAFDIGEHLKSKREAEKIGKELQAANPPASADPIADSRGD